MCELEVHVRNSGYTEEAAKRAEFYLDFLGWQIDKAPGVVRPRR